MKTEFDGDFEVIYRAPDFLKWGQSVRWFGIWDDPDQVVFNSLGQANKQGSTFPKKGDRLTWSFRGGRLNLYYRYPRRGRHPAVFQNYTNRPTLAYAGISRITNYASQQDGTGTIVPLDDATPEWRRHVEVARELNRRVGEKLHAALTRRLVEHGLLPAGLPRICDPSVPHLTLAVAYPLWRALALENHLVPHSLPGLVSAGFRRETLKGCVEHLLGTGGKRTVRLVGESLVRPVDLALNHSHSPGNEPPPVEGEARPGLHDRRQVDLTGLMLCAVLRGLVTVDHLQAVLQLVIQRPDPATRLQTELEGWGPVMRKFFRLYTPAGRMRLAEQLLTRPGQASHFSDVLRMWQGTPEILQRGEETDIGRLHNLLVPRQARYRQAGPDRAIPYSKKLGRLHGSPIGETGLTLVLPQRTEEVWEWGQAMSHCIGGYAEEAVRGLVLLLGVKRGEELLYNVAVTPSTKNIQQFRGRFNRDPAPEDYAAVLVYLNEKKVAHLPMSLKALAAEYLERAAAPAAALAAPAAPAMPAEGWPNFADEFQEVGGIW